MRQKAFARFLVIVAVSPAWAACAIAYASLATDHIPWTPETRLAERVWPDARIRITQVFPTSFFKRLSDGLCQVAILRIESTATEQLVGSVTATDPLTAADASETVVLHPGTNTITLYLPDDRRPRTMQVSLLLEGRVQQSFLCQWEPARHWKIYVVQTSHFDHGYTGLQQEVMKRRDEILAKVLEFCTLTDDWPEESRFRWMIESSFCLSHYLESQPWREDELRQRIQEGRIEIGAHYCHLASSTAGHEELVRNAYNSTVHLSALFDVDIATAVHTDVVGITWGAVTAWAGFGIRYFSLNPNFFYRGGNILHETDLPQAYYWVGPNQDRVLTWRSRDGYGEAPFLLEGIESALRELPLLLESYTKEGYPYDAIHLTRTGVGENLVFDFMDNSLPRWEVSETIRTWNEMFEYPKLINATSSQFFHYLEENFEEEVPEFRGDCPDWWADGVLTGAVAEGEVRRAHGRLGEAEILASACSLIEPDAPYPWSELDEAWRKTLLFDEHTWGYVLPFLPIHDQIWKQKQDAMREAMEISERITESALDTISRRINGNGWNLLLFNSLSWTRDDIVFWQPSADFPEKHLGGQYFHILDRDGNEIPYQLATNGNGQQGLVFLAKDIPSLGYTTYRVLPAAARPAFPSSLCADRSGISNQYYRVSIDPSWGIRGIYDIEQGRELVDARAPFFMSEFVSRQQGLFDLQDTRRPGVIREVHTDASGPVYASGVLELDDPDNPGCTITQEVLLYEGLKRVDFINTVNQFVNRVGESKYFVFPFAVPDFEFRLDVPNAVMRPFREQLPDFAKYYAVQHWIDVFSREQGFGITWAPVEGPMVELGEITKRSSWTSSVMPPFLFNPGEYPYEPRSSHIYSEIMNNFQNTNYNYHQAGSGVWRYSITSHLGSWDQPAVTRFGWDLASPIQVRFFEAEPGGTLPGSRSFLLIDQPNVKVLTVKRAEAGQGMIVRLFENEGRPAQVSLVVPPWKDISAWRVDLAEREKSSLHCEGNTVTFPVGAFDLVALRITGQQVRTSPDEAEEENGSGWCGCATAGTKGKQRVYSLIGTVALYLVPPISSLFRARRLRSRSSRVTPT